MNRCPSLVEIVHEFYNTTLKVVIILEILFSQVFNRNVNLFIQVGHLTQPIG